MGKGAIVNSAAVVRNMAIINTGATVEHDCVVGDFSHVAVNATLCGAVSLGQASFVAPERPSAKGCP